MFKCGDWGIQGRAYRCCNEEGQGEDSTDIFLSPSNVECSFEKMLNRLLDENEAHAPDSKDDLRNHGLED